MEAVATEKDFDKFYETVLKDRLQGFEAERLKVKRNNILIVSCILGIILSIVIAYVSHGVLPVGFAGVFLLSLIVVLIINWGKEKKYTARFKSEIVTSVIQFINKDFEYQPGSCINKNDYKNSGLFLQDFDRYKGDDYMKGKYGGTDFCFSELHTEYEKREGKNTTWVTIFKGLFFMADFNKNFSGRTYVWSEFNPQLNFFNKIFSSFADNLEKVTLESPDFEDRFIVYSTDQVEARYILTPSLMERLIKLQDMFDADIVFSFVNTNINVAIPVKDDLFEPTIYRAPNEDSIRKYYDTVNHVLSIIDELNLNRRIWNKD